MAATTITTISSTKLNPACRIFRLVGDITSSCHWW
jgi:hypothetical protein